MKRDIDDLCIGHINYIFDGCKKCSPSPSNDYCLHYKSVQEQNYQNRVKAYRDTYLKIINDEKGGLK